MQHICVGQRCVGLLTMHHQLATSAIVIVLPPPPLWPLVLLLGGDNVVNTQPMRACTPTVYLLEAAKLLGLGCVDGGWVGGRGAHIGVAVAADWAIDAKTQLVHVAFLCNDCMCMAGDDDTRSTHRYFTNVVLVWAVCLATLACARKCAAHRHAAGIQLVQKAACVALHAQATQPKRAHGLWDCGFVNMPWYAPSPTHPSKVFCVAADGLADVGARSDVWGDILSRGMVMDLEATS